MSLLRDLLKRGGHVSSGDGPLQPLSAKKSVKSYAASVKSSGGASMRSIAGSVLSFYSTVTGGGPSVPKRRRADYSTLGAPPEWYAADPPPPPPIPGAESPSAFPPYTMAHASVMPPTTTSGENSKSWLGIVLYSHAPATSPVPMYHNGAAIAGEVRMVLDKPTSLSSIDVWFTLTSDSVTDMSYLPVFSVTATLWDRKCGDPRAASSVSREHEQGNGPQHFKGKFPAGTYVLPFEFPALPADVVVKHPDEGRPKNLARVPLPPTYAFAELGSFSGSIKYIVGVNVAREGLGAIDEEFDVPVQYLPVAHPSASSPPPGEGGEGAETETKQNPFPYLPTHDDWPFAREEVGGWTLTPFGGRGRIGEEGVEVEGILGIPSPAVLTAAQTLPFTLLLHSASPLALQALAQPGAVEVGFCKSDVFARDALYPRSSARRNRRLERLAGGRVWLAGQGRPEEGAPRPDVELVEVPVPDGGGASSSKSPTSPGAKGSPLGRPSRMQTVWSPDSEQTLSAVDGADKDLDIDAEKREPSPVPSLDSLDSEPDDGERAVVRLDGEVRVPACSHPSFRFTSMAREYLLHILIQHPQYSHISPAASGIVGEVPVWYVLNRFAHVQSAAGGGPVDYATLPHRGVEIPVEGEGVVRLPKKMGHVTTKKRPTSRVQRVAAF